MAWQSVAPIDKSGKATGMSAYSANNPGNAANRYKPDSKQKKDGGNQKEPPETFRSLLVNGGEQSKRVEESSENMRQAEIIIRPRIYDAQPYSNYLRAKVVSGTLAFELFRISLEYEN